MTDGFDDRDVNDAPVGNNYGPNGCYSRVEHVDLDTEKLGAALARS